MPEKYSLLDLNTWPRKQHFEFYQTFSQPYFQIGMDLNASTLAHFCKEQQLSFFSAYLFLTQQAINKIAPFCQRIVDGEVRVYENVSVSMTVMADDQTIRFCRVPYADNFEVFDHQFKQAKAEAIAKPFLSNPDLVDGNNKATVYMSVIPWISFTGYSHAIHAHDTFGIPRLVFGKARDEDGKMPLTVDAHHALVDGLHVAQLVEQLQHDFDHPGVALS